MNDEPQQPENPPASDQEPTAEQPQGPAVGPNPTQPYYLLPPGYPPPPGAQPYYPPAPHRPSNNMAVASIIVSSGSIALLFLTGGIAAPITVISSAIGTFLGWRGKDDVDKGKSTVQRDLAVGGFWTGIGGIVLSILAIIAWIVIVILIAENENWFDGNDFDMQDFHNFDGP